MEVDYDVYAEGEAELGWFNCQVSARSEGPDGNDFELDELVFKIVEEIARNLKNAGLESAHLKVMGQFNSESAIANHVAADSEVELSLASEIRTRQADLIVNARVAAEPAQLEDFVSQSLAQLESQMGIGLQFDGVQAFKPGRPEPVHRFNEP